MKPIHWGLAAAAFALFVVVRLFMLERRRLRGIELWASFHRYDFSRALDESIGPKHREFDRLWTLPEQQARNVVRGRIGEWDFVGFDFYDVDVSRPRRRGRSSGRSMSFSAVVVETALRFKPLVIERESLLDSVAKRFGMDDVEIGDPEFDRRFLLTSKERQWTADLLQPDLRALLLRTPVLTFGSRLSLLEFRGGKILARGGNDGGFDAKDFQAVTEFLLELLELLETSPACR